MFLFVTVKAAPQKDQKYMGHIRPTLCPEGLVRFVRKKKSNIPHKLDGWMDDSALCHIPFSVSVISERDIIITTINPYHSSDVEHQTGYRKVQGRSVPVASYLFIPFSFIFTLHILFITSPILYLE